MQHARLSLSSLMNEGNKQQAELPPVCGKTESLMWLQLWPAHGLL